MVWPGRPGVQAACCLLLLLFCLAQRGLAIDGQSYKASDEETERVWNDPNCERTRDSEQGIDWDDVRAHFLTVPFPHTLPTINAVVRRLQKTSELDREAALCPFGVIAVLFFWIKYLIEGDTPQLPAAIAYFSLLDAFSSGMHPHLLDRSDWLVKDSRLIALRRALLGRRRAALASPPRYPRVFVYDKEVPEVRELTQGASFCGKGQWGMEVHIHEWLLSSGHLTKDPEEADFFFVPAYSICMFEGGFFPYPAIDELYTRMVRGLPHFRDGRGRDHIFTFGSGMSANVFRSWRREIPESVFLTPETWLFNDFPDITEPCFDTWKDIAIPGYLHRHEILSLTSQARPLSEREHLAVFLGRTDPSRGPHPATGGVDVRGAIRKLHLEGKIFVGQNLSIPDMHGVMGNAKFCFVPKGKSAWSLRFYEALFANCVPVVLSDYWELPFQDFLDVPSFVIKWPMENVGNQLLDFLEQLPPSVVEAYMASSRKLRCWYAYPPQLHEVDVVPEYDELYKVCPDLPEENAFEGIMRILERKRRTSTTMGRYFGPLRGSLPWDDSAPVEGESNGG
mmetsp:Transcript_10298/g.31034  ORF Transcript_10298/g.31034 Transcript_10298/m.31034 type:complete len:565 (-) Transcript_10298:21-1715(-)